MSRLLLVLSVLCCGLALAGCPSSTKPNGPEEGPTQTVLCTVPMVADLVTAVVGDVDKLFVSELLARGTDPHVYKPTTADSIAAHEAAAVFYVGLRLEAALAENFEQLAKQKPHIVALGPTVNKDRLLSVAGHSEYDPHLWMNVDLWAEIVPQIVATLTAIRPDEAATFQANAEALTARLTALDTYVKETVATIPEQKRVMITAHDAFNYFGDAYGVRVAGVQGVSTESEAGIKDIQNLVELVRETGIGTVFAESSTSDRSVAALVEAAENDGLDLELAGPLYADSTGAEDTWEGTYFGMIEHNVSLIASKLDGTVPEGGFRSTEMTEDATTEVTETAEESDE